MLSYLEHHAHPEMKKNTPILPTTVVDQLTLWDSERNRLRSTQGFLYQSFVRQEDYNEVLQYAQDIQVCQWNLDKKRMLFVTAAGHDIVRSYVQRKMMKKPQTPSRE